MKRSEHLEPLSHDHYEGLLVVGRLRKGLALEAAPEVMVAYVGHVWETRLRRHFEQEETILMPLLSAAGAGALGARMTGEHRVLQGLVARLAEEDADRPSLLDAFARALKDHIRFEERELFPELERRAGEDDLREVGRRLHAEAAGPPPDWTPAFWEG